MIDVQAKRCTNVACTKRALYNYKDKNGAIFCSDHADEDMINVKDTRCKHEGCPTYPCYNYNYRGKKSGLYCSTHCLPDMVNIKQKQCKHEGCTIYPLYNYDGEKPLYCRDHKTPDMIDVVSKRCQNCNKFATFNYLGESVPLFCKDHLLPGMINVKDKKCEHKGCPSLRTFNYNGEKSALCCKTHALSGMICIKIKRCENEKCFISASYNFVGEKIPRFCKKCASPGMVDVTHRQCKEDNCTTQPWYGIPGQSVTRCAQHKQPGMLRRSKSKCIQSTCKEFAIYGIDTPLYCEYPVYDIHNNLVENICASCGVIEVLNSNNICTTCDPEKFKTARLYKQRLVQLMKNLPNDMNIVSIDRMIDGGECIRERPDIVIDATTHYIVIEVDEHQHRDRACECEITRMINI